MRCSGDVAKSRRGRQKVREGEKGNESHHRTDTARLYFHFAPLRHSALGKYQNTKNLTHTSSHLSSQRINIQDSTDILLLTKYILPNYILL